MTPAAGWAAVPEGAMEAVVTMAALVAGQEEAERSHLAVRVVRAMVEVSAEGSAVAGRGVGLAAVGLVGVGLVEATAADSVVAMAADLEAAGSEEAATVAGLVRGLAHIQARSDSIARLDNSVPQAKGWRWPRHPSRP